MKRLIVKNINVITKVLESLCLAQIGERGDPETKLQRITT